MAETIPATMTVIEAPQPGGPGMLRRGERPVPQPGPGQLLIRTAAAGINRADLSQREGRYPAPPGVTDVFGLEAAGTVAALGPGVSGFAAGDAVCALLPGGGYAEYCVAHAGCTLPVPAGYDFVTAAGIMEAACTVWANVWMRGRLAAGETLLVHGGTSGIGSFAIQLARAVGARVLATAGSDEKCASCVRFGAARAINYRTEDFVAVVRSETEDGADVILDLVAGAYLQRNLEALALDGRLCIIALQGGATAELDIARLMRRRLTVTGSTLRARSDADKAAVVEGVRAHVWPHLDSGAVRPVIDSVVPLAEARRAHERMASSAHTGKIILAVAG